MISLIEIIEYYVCESLVPIWLRILRPIVNNFLEPPTEERIIKFFNPKTDKEYKYIEEITKKYFAYKPKPCTIWYHSFQREMHYTVYQDVISYYNKNIKKLENKKFNFIIILGLPRSGTSFVQNELLKKSNRLPNWKGLKLYELLYPLDPNKKLKGYLGVLAYKWLWPGFFKALDDSHYYSHDNYEEETILFRGCMRWMATDSNNPQAEIGYIYLMKILKILFNDGDTIVLKSPYHALYPNLVNKYFSTNGKIIILERDFNKVEPSWKRLQYNVNSLEFPLAEDENINNYNNIMENKLNKQLNAMREGTQKIIKTFPNVKVFKSEYVFNHSEKAINEMISYGKTKEKDK